MSWPRVPVAVLVGVALGGCGLDVRLPTTTGTPAARGPSHPTQTATAPTVVSNEILTPLGPAERARTTRSAGLALRRFGTLYINWDAADIERHLRQLAADSVGQARTAMQLEAAQTGADPELRRAGIANRGTVEAVAPLAGSANRYVVITRESTTATDSSAYAGLAAAWHLTLATVARRGSGWVVCGWQPQS